MSTVQATQVRLHEMAKAKTGRNDLCPCGSGKKYKRCCLDLGLPIPINDRLFITGVEVQAFVETVDDSGLGCWYLQLARDWANLCLEEDASHYQALEAILHAAIAAEAVANRLLEPLEEDWDKLERSLNCEAKWRRLLHQRLGVPKKAPGAREAFAELHRLFEVRNELVHAKHRANMIRRRQEVPTIWSKGTVTADISALDRERAEQLGGGKVLNALEPRRAAQHFNAVRALILLALEKHKNDEFDIVGQLRAAVRGEQNPPAQEHRPAGPS